MAPPRSLSLKKLSALIFDDEDPTPDAAAEEDVHFRALLAGEDFARCRFERAVSEGTTAPGQPFSRGASPEASDEEFEGLEQPAAPCRLQAFPQAAGLFRGRLVDPGEAVRPGQELIAVGPSGTADFVPQDELAELEALRACFEEEASPLFLVGRDGTAFLAPDGEHVEWDRLDAVRALARDETVASPAPSLASDDGRRAQRLQPLCPAARSLEPLQLEAEKIAAEDPPECSGERGPEGSVPRSPSLKKLSALLFAAGGDAAALGSAACEDAEELELEAPCARRAAASGEDAGEEGLSQWLLGSWLLFEASVPPTPIPLTAGCVLQ